MGCGVSNCVLIEGLIIFPLFYAWFIETNVSGPTGCVVVDALDSVESAKEVLGIFRHVTTKPIVAVILTNFDPDTSSGLSVFTAAYRNVGVYVHESFGINDFWSDSLVRRKRKMFLDGAPFIGEEEGSYIGNGLGKRTSAHRHAKST